MSNHFDLEWNEIEPYRHTYIRQIHYRQLLNRQPLIIEHNALFLRELRKGAKEVKSDVL